MRAAPTCLLLIGLVPLAAAPRPAPAQELDHANVWYLRHSGWAVNLGEALLIFDYTERMGMDDVTADTPRDIQSGFINPTEIGDLDVYVFVTHAHGDHYDPVIFEWQGEIENLTYIIGWEEEPESHCERFVGPEAECYALGGLRSTVELDEMQVYTVDSDHNDIPEVAYLVRYGDWVLYHNGDYMGDPPVDYAYLKTFSDRIDLAIVSGVPGRAWPHVARAVLMAREFDPTIMFAMHFRDDEMCRDFMAEMEADGVETEIVCPTKRGQRFTVVKGGTVEARRTRQLTDDPAQDGFPSWSPDGSRLVFSRYGRDVAPEKTGLWLVSPEGGEPRQLTTAPGEHPDWSPDGRHIAFDGDFGNSIQMVSASGGTPVRIVPDTIPVFRGGQPKWSPDGSRIAFKAGPSVWVLEVASGSLEKVFTRENMIPIPACWSHDGTEIFVYLREMENPYASIWAVSASGEGGRRLTPEEQAVYRYADLSPDGSVLAVVWCEGRNCDLWAMPAGGGKRVQLTSHPDYDDGPVWSPDGKTIAFVSTRSGSFDVWTLEVDWERVRRELAPDR